MYRLIPVFVLFLLMHNLSAQDTAKVQGHNPKKALLLSAIIPGAGQIYNKKYWKPPVIYAGFATLGYLISTNSHDYKIYRDAYRIRTDNDPLTIDNFTEKYTDENLKLMRDYYRRNIELSVIVTSALYMLNLIDAVVDAHLYDFKVSDDLTLNVQPAFSLSAPRNSMLSQIKLTLRF